MWCRERTRYAVGIGNRESGTRTAEVAPFPGDAIYMRMATSFPQIPASLPRGSENRISRWRESHYQR